MEASLLPSIAFSSKGSSVFRLAIYPKERIVKRRGGERMSLSLKLAGLPLPLASHVHVSSVNPEH